MNKITISTLNKLKSAQEKFTMVAAYDASFAGALERAGVEVILIGDSLGMTIQGHNSTVPVTTDDICYHVRAVANGNNTSLIIGDMPFMTYPDTATATTTATKLMQAGAHMVKLEGGRWLTDTVKALSNCGVPVCCHLGLTPQSVNKLGGYKVQGRDDDAARIMLEDALTLEAAGADLLVLECVPVELAKQITDALTIPVVGIGAGADTDAQVLVMYDMIGLTPRAPKFSKDFLAPTGSIEAALALFVSEVKSATFPSSEHTFS